MHSARCTTVFSLSLMLTHLPLPGPLDGADFALDPASPGWPTASDVLADRPGPVSALPRLAIPAAALGLQAQDVIDALSDGRDPIDPELHPGHRMLIFSVTRQTAGLAGTAVAQERAMDTAPPAGANPNGHASDLFAWEGVAGMNILAPPPLGWSLGSQSGDEANAHLGIPGAGQPGDNVIAYDRRTLRCMGAAGAGQDDAGGAACQVAALVFFSLRAGSPTLAVIGALPGDVLVAGGPLGNTPKVFVRGAALGLPAQADLDALSLEVKKNAAGKLVPHRVLFSVDSGSAGFALPGGNVVASGADVIRFDGASTTVAITANDLGLAVADDVDALENLVAAGDGGDMILFDVVGDAKAKPAPGGRDFVVEASPAPGPAGVALSLPPCLEVTHDVDFENWANAEGVLGVDVDILTSSARRMPATDGVPARVFELKREGSTPGLSWATFPSNVAGIPVHSFEFATQSGGEVVSEMVILPDPGIIAILIGLLTDETAMTHVSVSSRLARQSPRGQTGKALVLSTTLEFEAEIGFTLGGQWSRGDRLEISRFMDYTDDAVLGITGTGVTVSGLDGQDTLGGFAIHGVDIRRGILRGGLAHESLGNARVGEGADGGVQVSEIGESGQDGVGVSVDSFSGDAKGLDEMILRLAPGSLGHGTAGRAPRKLRIQSVTDGTSNTILFGERLSLAATAPGVLTVGVERDSSEPERTFRVEAYLNGRSNGVLELGIQDLEVFQGDAELIGLGFGNDHVTFQFQPEVTFDGAHGSMHGTEFRFSDPRAGGRKLTRIELTGENLGSFTITGSEQIRRAVFRRGDTSNDGSLGLADAIATLDALFIGRMQLTCDDAADANDDGQLSIADPIFTLAYLFLGGVEIPLPGAGVCGVDPGEDVLGCESYSNCE